LQKEEALKLGYQWKEEMQEPFESSYVIPDHIKDVKDDVLSVLLKCEKTGKPYRIIKQELEYYRIHHIPLPRVNPFERIQERSDVFHVGVLHTVSCAKCGAKVETMLDENNQTIYCEPCFQKEVY